MKKIKLLDCTLRDGGYINDWEFGHSVITGTYKRLDAAGVDFIEVGFLDDRRPFDINRTIQPDTNCFNEIFRGVEKKSAIPVAMIDYGTCDIANIGDCSSSFIDGIRVIFKKEKIESALPFCKAIKEKGYKLFIQAISITAYSDLEMLEYVQKINEIKPYAFSIVDTYGLLDHRKLTNYFNLINNNLDPDIIIGYHAHNNFQLAFSNSIKFLGLETKRTVVVDSTVYGMGKSAGNCASELISMHMNEKYGCNYDIDQFLEILDTDLMSIYKRHYWGYKYNFYISAMQNCHPNYVQFLLDKKTLSVSSINEILAKIPNDIKLLYDQQYIEKAYLDYQSNIIDDREAIDCISKELARKTIVLLGPGKTIESDRNKILEFINKKQALLISVNFEPNVYFCDYVFISNAKRYSKLADLAEKEANSKLIITSNITAFDRPAEYVLNYQGLMREIGTNRDIALLLAIAALLKAGVDKVYLAGFDGFSIEKENYFDSKYSFVRDDTQYILSNETTIQGLRELSKRIDIRFLTDSLYEEAL